MPIKHTFRVPTAPFIAWLKERCVKYGGIKPYAEKIEEDHIWLGLLIGGQYKTISVAKVDAIMCKDDTSHIRELYPEIYDED